MCLLFRTPFLNTTFPFLPTCLSEPGVPLQIEFQSTSRLLNFQTS